MSPAKPGIRKLLEVQQIGAAERRLGPDRDRTLTPSNTMTTHHAESANLPELIASLNAEVTELRAELTRGEPGRSGEWLTAKEVAMRYRLKNVKWVYEHKEMLGAICMGEQGSRRKPRLRFNSERVEAALALRKPPRVGTQRRGRGPNVTATKPPTRTPAGNPLLF